MKLDLILGVLIKYQIISLDKGCSLVWKEEIYKKPKLRFIFSLRMIFTQDRISKSICHQNKNHIVHR